MKRLKLLKSRLFIPIFGMVAITSIASALNVPAITVTDNNIHAVSVTFRAESVTIITGTDTLLVHATSVVLYRRNLNATPLFAAADTAFVSEGYFSLTQYAAKPGLLVQRDSSYLFYVVAHYNNGAVTTSAVDTFHVSNAIVAGFTFAPALEPEMKVWETSSYRYGAASSTGGAVALEIESISIQGDTRPHDFSGISIDSHSRVLSFTPRACGIYTVVLRAYLISDSSKYSDVRLTTIVHHFLTGTLRDGSGNYLRGKVQVVRIDSATGAVLSSAVAETDTNYGRYYFPADSGTFLLSASSPGYSSMWYRNAYVRQNGESVTLGYSDSVVADFTLLPASQVTHLLRGKVTSAATGHGIGALITFIGFPNGIPDSVRWERRYTFSVYSAYRDSVTDSTGTRFDTTGNGFYAASLFDDYTWIAYALSNSYSTRYFGGVGDPLSASEVPHGSGFDTANFSLPLKVADSNIVFGFVAEHSGRGVEANVIAYPLSNFGLVDANSSATVSDTLNGFYSFSDLEPGSYVLFAVPFSNDYGAGYHRAGDFAALSWRGATVLNVSPTSSIGSDTIEVRRANGADGTAGLRGVVRGIPGRTLKNDRGIQSVPPVMGVSVIALNDQGAIVAHTFSDAAGRYLLTGIGSQPHTIVIDKVGFAPYQEQKSGLAQGETIGEDVLLSPSLSSVPMSAVAGTVQATAYPNPANSTLSIEFIGVSGSGVIRVFDASGAEVYSRQIQTVAGVNVTILNVAGYTSGAYLVSAPAGSSQTIVPFVIQR